MPPSLPRLLFIVTLPILSFLGYRNTFKLLSLNNTGRQLSSIFSSGPDARFPGSNSPLLSTYTGISQVDDVFTTLVAFFAPVVDGSLDGFARWVLGQFGVAWCLLVVESLRAGNKARVISWIAIFGILIQTLSFTVITPIYLLIHTLTSPISATKPAPSTLLISPTHLNLLPITIFLSYIIPSLAMGIEPPVVSSNTHQRLIAFWQIFPALTTITHTTLHIVNNLFAPLPTTTEKPKTSPTAYMKASKRLKNFNLLLVVPTHLYTIFAAVFDPQTSFSKIFLPHNLVHGRTAPVPTLAIGVKNFLQWDLYIGLSSMLLWSAYLYWNARIVAGRGVYRDTESDRDLLLKVIFWGAVAGPMGITLWLLEQRDEIILAGFDEKDE